MKCKKGYEVKPMKSPAGWYMGTVDENGCPNCRISRQYAKTEELAEKLPLDRQTNCMENDFCNSNGNCFKI